MIDLIIMAIFIALGLYILIKQPQWALSRYEKMPDHERKAKRLNATKVNRSCALLCFVIALFELGVFIYNTFL